MEDDWSDLENSGEEEETDKGSKVRVVNATVIPTLITSLSIYE